MQLLIIKHKKLFMSSPINRYSLKPGQWVVFSHDKESVSKELVGPFKVISRDDAMLDTCFCFLMNVEGKLVGYCPNTCRLGLKDLPWGYNVKVIGKEEIRKTFEGKLEELQSKALGHLKDLAQHKYFGKGFNPDNETTTLSGKEIREKYGLSLLD